MDGPEVSDAQISGDRKTCMLISWDISVLLHPFLPPTLPCETLCILHDAHHKCFIMLHQLKKHSLSSQEMTTSNFRCMVRDEAEVL